MEDGYYVNDQELAVNDSLHLDLSEDEVDSTLPPPGVTEETLIIDETILFEGWEDFDDEEDTCDEVDEKMIQNCLYRAKENRINIRILT